MTEPIAVDAPAKPAFSRSAALPPGVGPLVEALTGAASAAAPKVEPPKPPVPKVEAPKPAESSTAAAVATAAVTVAAAATGAAPVAAAVAPAAGLLSRFTKKQLTIGAAVCSLFVGAGALRLLFPAKDAAPKVETAANEKALTDKVPPTQPISAPTPPLKAPALQEEPRNEPGSTLPPLPVMPPAPVNNSGAKITGFTPVAPAAPSVIPEPRPNTPSARPEPDFTVPLPPGSVTPAGAAFAAMPPAPPAAGAPALPAPPATSAPPLPALPMPPSVAPPAVTPPAVTPPAVTPEKAPAIAPPAELAPMPPTQPGGTASKPAVPAPSLPGPETPALPGLPGVAPFRPKPPENVVPMPPAGTSGAGPALPALPGGTGMNPVPAPVDLTPKLPAVPDTKPMGGVAPPVLPAPTTGGTSGTGMGTSGVAPPSVFPLPDAGMGSGPKPPAVTETKPPAPVFDPPTPAFPAPGGTSIGVTKPAGATEVKPTAPERAPRTSYDVDVYDPKQGDTYESISQEWYNSKQYAAALKAFNQNQALQGGRYVNVPPLYVLQRQSPTATGATGGARPTITPVSDAPNWSATPTARPAATGRNTFTVPRGGMTLQQIARQTMSSEQRWRDIYDLNPQITNANELLPQGTELKMPSDAKLP